jgi:hypothetical protein
LVAFFFSTVERRTDKLAHEIIDVPKLALHRPQTSEYYFIESVSHVWFFGHTFF